MMTGFGYIQPEMSCTSRLHSLACSMLPTFMNRLYSSLRSEPYLHAIMPARTQCSITSATTCNRSTLSLRISSG